MKQITAHELTAMSEQAASVPRLRAHRTLHEELSDPVQRLAIAMEPGTYIRPHRHPQTWELLTPLRGRFVVLQFNDETATRRSAPCSAKKPKCWRCRPLPGMRCCRSMPAAWCSK